MFMAQGFDGEGEFQSIEDLRMSKNRTSSVLSTNDQKFFSVEDVSKERPASVSLCYLFVILYSKSLFLVNHFV